MNNKYKLPNDIKSVVLGLVKGQNRRLKLYQKKYNDIIEKNFVDFQSSTSTTNIHNSSTELKILKIEELNNEPDTIILKTIQDSLENICSTYPVEISKNLYNGILLNCSSKHYSYEKLNIPTISRNKFYSYKNMFLYDIATKFNLIA